MPCFEIFLLLLSVLTSHTMIKSIFSSSSILQRLHHFILTVLFLFLLFHQISGNLRGQEKRGEEDQSACLASLPAVKICLFVCLSVCLSTVSTSFPVSTEVSDLHLLGFLPRILYISSLPGRTSEKIHETLYLSLSSVYRDR